MTDMASVICFLFDGAAPNIVMLSPLRYADNLSIVAITSAGYWAAIIGINWKVAKTLES